MSQCRYALKDADLDEQAADVFAIEVLNGRKNATYTVLGDQVNSKELAHTAHEFGKANQVDPGHIALNFANKSGKWEVGIAAAKLLESERQPAWVVINEAMWGGIDSKALPLDTVEFLGRVTDSSLE